MAANNQTILVEYVNVFGSNDKPNNRAGSLVAKAMVAWRKASNTLALQLSNRFVLRDYRISPKHICLVIHRYCNVYECHVQYRHTKIKLRFSIFIESVCSMVGIVLGYSFLYGPFAIISIIIIYMQIINHWKSWTIILSFSIKKSIEHAGYAWGVMILQHC